MIKVSWATAFLLTPDGKVERCEVTRSSGVANLDQATCVYAFTRFKWQPARDMRGNPAYGLFRGFFTWRYPGQAHRPWPNAVNLEISPAALPAAMKALSKRDGRFGCEWQL